MAAVAIDPEYFDRLKEIIDETYNDGIDQIDEAWAYPDGSIQAFATDEGRQLAVEIGEDVSIFQTGEDASFQASFAGGKPRNCQKGIACGGTCISKGKTCSKKASAGQKAKAKEIVAMVHVPKQAEAKAKGKKTDTAKTKKAKTNQSSDDIKKSILKDESFFEEERDNPKYANAIKGTKAYNATVRSFGEVGDVSKMSADDITNILVKIDSPEAVKLLGITKNHYMNKKPDAKNFYREASRKIHPDVNKHPDAAKAFSYLNEMYKNMTA